MRTTVTVVGLGNRIKGKKADGREYDFCPVAFTFPDKDFSEGVKAVTINIDYNDLYLENLTLGNSREVVMHPFNGRYFIDAFL